MMRQHHWGVDPYLIVGNDDQDDPDPSQTISTCHSPFLRNLHFIQIDLVWTEFYHHELECVKLIFQDHRKIFDSEGRLEPYVTILLSK